LRNKLRSENALLWIIFAILRPNRWISV